MNTPMPDTSPDTFTLPDTFARWFESRGWSPRDYQLDMIKRFSAGRSTLLIAPTGAGKTLSGFLPSLIDLADGNGAGLHTLYISPLKALTNDIERNIQTPITELDLPVRAESRTGDTSSYRRRRQREKPPHLLLTTPESLMLMLSYADAPRIFGNLKAVIVDEAHSLASSKRGELLSLALSQLESLSPGYVRLGLSATVAEPHELAAWLGPTGKPVETLTARAAPLPELRILESAARIPYSGFVGRYAAAEILDEIEMAETTLVFVNTRSQAEIMFRALWDHNRNGLPIALYHGSLESERRRTTEALMAEGKLRAIVATSALELGVDWGDIDLVIQVGAPKGISRLLQRIGRSNHRMDEPSAAVLVPGNRFEAVECAAAIEAISERALDSERMHAGSLDIIPQFIVNRACGDRVTRDSIYAEIIRAWPYRNLPRDSFERLFDFVLNGGYALSAYEQYRRLTEVTPGVFTVTSRRTASRHRQNIGTIVEAARLKVKRLRRKHQGKVIGEVEEYFAQQLSKGDTFLFSGELLTFEGIKDMVMEARPAKGGEPKVPAYVGGQLPLSTYLADRTRALLNNAAAWSKLPGEVAEWLTLQAEVSAIPGHDSLMIEHFPRAGVQFTVLYTFEGRPANQTLGMLITRRLERLKLGPIGFSINDYALCVTTVEPLDERAAASLFTADLLEEELDAWLTDSPMLRRAFRRVAMVSGLTEQNHAGTRKSMKQVTFSTDLIFDVLRRYDEDHILLEATRQEAERELLDLARIRRVLSRFDGRTRFFPLQGVSPMAISLMLNVRAEHLPGEGIDKLLEQESLQAQGEAMMDEARAAIGKKADRRRNANR